MKRVLILGCLLALPLYSSADVQSCSGTSPFGVRQFLWDSETGSAKFVDIDGAEHAGSVTLTRTHDKGEKVNLRFLFENPKKMAANTAEFIIFPVGSDYRIIGVGYVEADGAEHLSTLIENSDAACVKL